MGSPARFNGMPVTITEMATAAIPKDRWDWSAYRSPSRAKRRRDRSKIITREPAAYQLNGSLVIHPKLWAQMRASLGGHGGSDAG